MADISKINPNGTEFDIKDAVARSTKAQAIEITSAAYETLSTAEKNDATKIYFIPDYEGGGGSDDNLYIVDGSYQIPTIERYQNTSGAIIVDVQSDFVKVTSTNGNNGAYGAIVATRDYNYAVLELNYCTGVYSWFGIGSRLSYDSNGTQIVKTALDSKSSPYRWVVNISNYTENYYCYLSCGGNARFDIRRMFLSKDYYNPGIII